MTLIEKQKTGFQENLSSRREFPSEEFLGCHAVREHSLRDDLKTNEKKTTVHITTRKLERNLQL